MTLLCIIPGPKKMLHRQTDRVRWCFDCRRYEAHDIVVYGDEEPSYYDPIAIRECARCGHDRTDFPGLVGKTSTSACLHAGTMDGMDFQEFGDRPFTLSIRLGDNEFHDAEKRLQTKLKEDPDIAARVLAAMRDPERSKQLIQYEFCQELEAAILERLNTGHELKMFCRQLASYITARGETDSNWGVQYSPVEVSVNLSLVEDLKSSVGNGP